MSNHTASGEYSLISGWNSIVDLSNPMANEAYMDVSVKTLVEYESDLPDDPKEEIINADIDFTNSWVDNEKKRLHVFVDGMTYSLDILEGHI